MDHTACIKVRILMRPIKCHAIRSLWLAHRPGARVALASRSVTLVESDGGSKQLELRPGPCNSCEKRLKGALGPCEYGLVAALVCAFGRCRSP